VLVLSPSLRGEAVSRAWGVMDMLRISGELLTGPDDGG